MIRKAIVAAIATLVPVITASAVDVGQMFGHSIEIVGDYPDRIIRINGREMHKNAILTFDELVLVSGVPALIGNSSNGGNACDGTPFVISFPSGGNPRFDGPIEACAIINYTLRHDGIDFSTKDVPGQGTRRWSWSPSEGLQALEDVAFAPKDTTGWQALRERSLQHPADALNNIAIAADVKALLGADFGTFQEIITGTGSGEFRGADYIGQTCTPHMCREQEALLFLSAEEKQVYAAWKPLDQKIEVRPPVGQWPEAAKRELRAWAKTWK